ncbi:MAG: hypothetical protein C0594_17885 [Marinilabiliales bacterium]|nr:MAG: hypothetical protein C0594_17885 [Marinilabiliales bacterium]
MKFVQIYKSEQTLFAFIVHCLVSSCRSLIINLMHMKNFTFYLIFALIFLSATVSAQWQQLGNTINDPDWTQLGDAVEISNSGDVIVVGEPAGNIPLYTGQIEVFRLQNSTWTVIGSPITGVNTDDGFGYAVACNHDATIVAGGAPYSDVNGANSGQVQVFKFESGSWSQMGADLNGETASDKYGYAVSLSDDGNILAVGARECSNTNGAQAGRVYVYEYSGSDSVLKGTVRCRCPIWMVIKF